MAVAGGVAEAGRAVVAAVVAGLQQPVGAFQSAGIAPLPCEYQGTKGFHVARVTRKYGPVAIPGAVEVPQGRQDAGTVQGQFAVIREPPGRLLQQGEQPFMVLDPFQRAGPVQQVFKAIGQATFSGLEKRHSNPVSSGRRLTWALSPECRRGQHSLP